MIQKFKLLFVHEITHLCLIENCDVNAGESSGGLPQGALAIKIMSYTNQRQEKMHSRHIFYMVP